MQLPNDFPPASSRSLRIFLLLKDTKLKFAKIHPDVSA